jgi:long-subunit acyl-CoA synthetase (AMP-forming)
MVLCEKTMIEVYLFQSPVAALKTRADTIGHRSFLFQPTPSKTVREYSYAEAFLTARRIANFLHGQGFSRGARVGLLSKNCAEWFIVDWALQLGGFVSVPLFPTSPENKIQEALQRIPVQFLFIGKLDHAESYQPLTDLALPTASLPYPGVRTDFAWQELLQTEPLGEQDLFWPTEDDLMTIHQTSGTNGQPKGVELTFGAYHYACQQATEALAVSEQDRLISYLPLAHIAERMMIQGNAVFSGAQVYFVHSLATFAKDLRRAKPTAFMSVPRLWKNFQMAIEQKLPAPLLKTFMKYAVTRKLLGKLIRHLLGLRYARLTGSGAAAMPIELLQWYERIGIPISEAWGMTETCGLSAMNYPYRPERAGTIGQPIPGTEMKLSPEGEVLIRSKGITRAYFDDPAATHNAFTEDGFFKTGDKATWDETRQAWQLIGRMNDSFKSAKGKYVHPQVIESRLLTSPLIEQACVVGEGMAQPVAIVQLPESTLLDKFMEQLHTLLADVNSALEHHEQLARVFVSKEMWTPENQLLTPTMKPRRGNVSALIADHLYQHSRDKIVVLGEAD